MEVQLKRLKCKTRLQQVSLCTEEKEQVGQTEAYAFNHSLISSLSPSNVLPVCSRTRPGKCLERSHGIDHLPRCASVITASLGKLKEETGSRTCHSASTKFVSCKGHSLPTLTSMLTRDDNVDGRVVQSSWTFRRNNPYPGKKSTLQSQQEGTRCTLHAVHA